MPTMNTNDEYTGRWQRVAVAMEERAIALGWTLKRLYEEAEVSETTFLAMRKRGQPIKKPAKVTALERGLGWEPGSVAAILDGGEPMPVDRSPPVDEITRRLDELEGQVARLLQGVDSVIQGQERLLEGQVAGLGGIDAVLRQLLPEAAAQRRSSRRDAPRGRAAG